MTIFAIALPQSLESTPSWDLRELSSDSVGCTLTLWPYTSHSFPLVLRLLNSGFYINIKNAIFCSYLYSTNVYFLEIFFNETWKYSLFSNVVLLGASIRENICFYFIPLTGILNICNLHEKKLQQSNWVSFKCEKREKVLQMKMIETTLLGKSSEGTVCSEWLKRVPMSLSSPGSPEIWSKYERFRLIKSLESTIRRVMMTGLALF